MRSDYTSAASQVSALRISPQHRWQKAAQAGILTVGALVISCKPAGTHHRHGNLQRNCFSIPQNSQISVLSCDRWHEQAQLWRCKNTTALHRRIRLALIRHHRPRLQLLAVQHRPRITTSPPLACKAKSGHTQHPSRLQPGSSLGLQV